MKPLFLAVAIGAYLVTETAAYTRCSYSYYDSFYRRYRTRYYSCSSSEYCCGTRSCCMATYARWYLWFLIGMFFLIVFLIWWYYRYRYRPRHAVVANVPAVRAVQTTTYPTVQTTTYPAAQINMGPQIVQYSAYPQPVAYNQPPPPYSVAATTVYR